MVIIYLSIATVIETEKHLRLPITQRMDRRKLLWRSLRNKEEDEAKLITMRVDDRSLEATERHNFLINYKFGRIPVQVDSGRQMNYTSENILAGKPTKISKETV